jgi:cyclo(L-tyrosyl-L-tyrosyl) synthase
MEVEALTNSCSQIFELQEHCCFGISPFNSYFSEERIRELALWGQSKFKAMHFFVPDGPSVHTLEAVGYPRDKAEWKARRQAQYLKNKIKRALSSLAIGDREIDEMILDSERLSATPRYNALLKEVNDLFESDERFRTECLSASRWVLMQKVSGDDQFTDHALLTAVKYFLSEIPLFADTAGIVGRSSSVFCYHQRVEFLERFYARNISFKPASNQGFLIVQPRVYAADDNEKASIKSDDKILAEEIQRAL